MSVFRNEIKYFCSDDEINILKSRVSTIMAKDPHLADNSFYTIRSIYFDDMDDTCLRENIDGTSPREKWRIRAYDLDQSYIVLECKRKEGCMTQKIQSNISYEEFGDIMSNVYFETSGRPLVNRFMALKRSLPLIPKVIVEYRRYPYFFPLGNVRVTFDQDICSSADIDRFWEPDIRKRTVLPVGYNLMEIKFDSFIPDHIIRALQLSEVRRTAFSKYSLCRQYSFTGRPEVYL